MGSHLYRHKKRRFICGIVRISIPFPSKINQIARSSCLLFSNHSILVVRARMIAFRPWLRTFLDCTRISILNCISLFYLRWMMTSNSTSSTSWFYAFYKPVLTMFVEFPLRGLSISGFLQEMKLKRAFCWDFGESVQWF